MYAMLSPNIYNPLFVLGDLYYAHDPLSKTLNLGQNAGLVGLYHARYLRTVSAKYTSDNTDSP